MLIQLHEFIGSIWGLCDSYFSFKQIPIFIHQLNKIGICDVLPLLFSLSMFFSFLSNGSLQIYMQWCGVPSLDKVLVTFCGAKGAMKTVNTQGLVGLGMPRLDGSCDNLD